MAERAAPCGYYVARANTSVAMKPVVPAPAAAAQHDGDRPPTTPPVESVMACDLTSASTGAGEGRHAERHLQRHSKETSNGVVIIRAESRDARTTARFALTKGKVPHQHVSLLKRGSTLYGINILHKTMHHVYHTSTAVLLHRYRVRSETGNELESLHRHQQLCSTSNITIS